MMFSDGECRCVQTGHMVGGPLILHFLPEISQRYNIMKASLLINPRLRVQTFPMVTGCHNLSAGPPGFVISPWHPDWHPGSLLSLALVLPLFIWSIYYSHNEYEDKKLEQIRWHCSWLRQKFSWTPNNGYLFKNNWMCSYEFTAPCGHLLCDIFSRQSFSSAYSFGIELSLSATFWQPTVPVVLLTLIWK